MAKLRMTYKNLKALRKSREYQALLVDLVSVGVVPKATAEGLLGYNIPANLITDNESSGTDDLPIVDPGPDREDPGPDREDLGSGIEQGSDTGNTVTLLYFNEGGREAWETAKYDITNDPTIAGIVDFAGIVAFAKDAFNDDTINTGVFVEVNPEYVEGTSDLNDKYVPLDPQPQPKTLEPGMLIQVYYRTAELAG